MSAEPCCSWLRDPRSGGTPQWPGKKVPVSWRPQQLSNGDWVWNCLILGGRTLTLRIL